MKYKVMRDHIGDQQYRPGDVREANEADVKYLVRSGVLVASQDDKSEPPLENAEGASKATATKGKKP